MKIVRILSYSGPHFPALELNAERYFVSLRIQSECGKIRTIITPNTDTFYEVPGTGKSVMFLYLNHKCCCKLFSIIFEKRIYVSVSELCCWCLTVQKFLIVQKLHQFCRMISVWKHDKYWNILLNMVSIKHSNIKTVFSATVSSSDLV